MALLIDLEPIEIQEAKALRSFEETKAKQTFMSIHKFNSMFKNAAITERNDKKQVQIHIQIYNPILRKQGFLKVEISLQKYYIIFQIKMVENKLPISIKSQKILLQAVRQTYTINSRYLSGLLSNFNILINEGGLITLRTSIMLSKQIICNSTYFQRFYKSIVKQLLQMHTHFFTSILKIANLLHQNLEYCLLINLKQVSLQKSLQRFFYKCERVQNIKKKIQKKIWTTKLFESCSDSQDKISETKVSKKNHNMLLDPSLYTNNFGISFQKKIEVLNEQELSLFETFLAEPKPRLFNKIQNRFTFNYIQVSKPESVQTTSYQLQDYFHYRIAKLKFKYAKTSNQQYFLNNHQNNLTEPMIMSPIFRQENSTDDLLMKNVFIKVKNKPEDMKKILHQLSIINKFRLTSSGYLFKYYCSTQNNFAFKETLLIDAYSGMTLETLLNNNQHTFSLRIKLMYLIQLAHAFCFLKQNNITYLSFNKKKIIIRHNDMSLIKLVDFSSSYNKKICKQFDKFVPDYTIQYAAPQIFLKDYLVYNEKQDVYSLGMFAYQILNDQNFLNYSEIKTITRYQTKGYMKKQLICPQKGQYMCYRKIYNYLSLLISKCLNSDAELRPSPYWVVILLKQIMSLLLKT